MEKLSKEQQEAIKKMSNERLVHKLATAGLTEEDLEHMDREARLKAWAQIIFEGSDQPQTALAVEKLKLLEAQEERKLRQKQLEWEMLKGEREAGERQSEPYASPNWR